MSKNMKRLLKVLGIIIVSLVVVVLIVRGISGVVVNKKFNGEMERMKAEGKYIEYRDFEIQCEDSENAALPWKEIEKMFFLESKEVRIINNSLNKVLDVEILDEEEKAKVSELISRNKQNFEKFKEAIKRPYFKYETDWESPAYDQEIPNLVKAYRFMKLHNLNTFLIFEEGRINEAVDQCVSGLTFSHRLLDEPILMTYLMSVAIDRMQIELLNRIVSSKELDDEILLKILKVLDIDVWHTGLTKSIIMEKAALFDTIKGVLTDKEQAEDFGYDPSIIVWLLRPLLKSDWLHGMKLYEEAEEMSKMPYYRLAEISESFDKKIKKIPRYHLITRLLFPDLRTAYLKKAALEAEILAAKAGIACKIYQNKHGTFPEQLSQLVPDILSEVPTDPFSGDPLIYRQTPSGFLVYSVGSNRRDDGGKETRAITKLIAEKDDDWAWYERKE